jgi:hypothetical protein
MSKIGRHAEGTVPISYFATAAHKAELQRIAAELYPHVPKPFSTLLRQIHTDFLNAHKAPRALPQTPTRAQDRATLLAAQSKANALLEKKKAQR